MTEQPLRPWPEELETWAIANQSASGHESGDGGQRPQAEAISVASVWQMESPAAADQALSGESAAFVYRRDGHPNERALAGKLARLHAAQRALLTAQGMSAIAAIALAVLKPGAKVWIGNELYGKSTKLFAVDLQRWGILTRLFDPTCLQDIDELSQSSIDLVLIETLSNPRLRIPDISAVAQATHCAGGLVLVDNTFATHLICQPLPLGADLVIESLSKQVNGHSDSMLGLIATNDAGLADRIQQIISSCGMASSPLDCYLTHRGLMSLAVRMERACSNALALAQALSGLGNVLSVDYPGLEEHAQHALAQRQFRGGYGWMLSFTLDIPRERVQAVFQKLQPEIAFVPSLGDVCTTLSHPASTSHRAIDPDTRNALGIREGTIRVSCGVEPCDWLIQKFVRALSATVAPIPNT